MKNLLLFAQQKYEPVIEQRRNCDSGDNSQGCVNVLPQVSAAEDQVQRGLVVVFAILAALAILVIVLSAINLAASEGNPEKISKSKRSIIYALIGLVIALLAEAIVLAVLGRF